MNRNPQSLGRCVARSLCLCFCARDDAITKTLSAWPVITWSACGEVVASEQPDYYNNCYYYPESTTEGEREQERETEHTSVMYEMKKNVR